MLAKREYGEAAKKLEAVTALSVEFGQLNSDKLKGVLQESDEVKKNGVLAF